MFRSSSLGFGSYGQVVKVHDGESGQEYAGKIFDSDVMGGISQETMWEIAVLKKITHPNIIKVEKVVTSVDHHTEVCMCMKVYPNCLDIYVESIKSGQTLQVAFGLLSALRCLQLLGIVHRDIKPENVLLTNNIEPILIDFSFVTAVDRDVASPITISGTPSYCSEESCGANYKPTYNLDWYALGVVLFECVQKKRLRFDRDKSAIKFLQSQRANMTAKIAIARVIKSLLDPDPLARMSPTTASLELGEAIVDGEYMPLKFTRLCVVDRSLKGLTKAALRPCTWTLAQILYERCGNGKLALYLASKMFECEPEPEACGELEFLIDIDFCIFDT
jgi:serine/threonine protein kinase